MRKSSENYGKKKNFIKKILNTTQSYYAQYENGHRPLPAEHIITLCKFYGVSADYLLGLPENLKYPKR